MQWRSVARAAATNQRAVVRHGHATYLRRVTTPAISLTESAARRVASIAARQHKPAILRLAVDGGGCAGFTYKFELAPAAEGDDQIAETDGVKLVVDPVSLELVTGSAVDFVEDLGGAAFRVTNPNAQSGCGCGSSFSV
jgi:iron-sulfur cluster assembly accessory protein